MLCQYTTWCQCLSTLKALLPCKVFHVNFSRARMRLGNSRNLWWLGRIWPLIQLKGVGFENLQSTSLVLKMRWFSLIMIDDSDSWVLLAWARIARSLDLGFRRRSRRNLVVVVALLLDDFLCITRSPLLWDILQGINKARKALYFDGLGVWLPFNLIVDQLLLLF